MSETKVDSAPKGLEPIVIEPLKLNEIRPELLETDLCWYGSLPNSPIQNVNLAGVNFVRETHSIQRQGPDQPDMVIPKAGNLHRLSRYQVGKMSEALKRYVVRMDGARPDVYDVTSQLYSPSQHDVPVGKFIYFCRVPEGVAFDRDSNKALPMC